MQELYNYPTNQAKLPGPVLWSHSFYHFLSYDLWFSGNVIFFTQFGFGSSQCHSDGCSYYLHGKYSWIDLHVCSKTLVLLGSLVATFRCYQARSELTPWSLAAIIGTCYQSFPFSSSWNISNPICLFPILWKKNTLYPCLYDSAHKDSDRQGRGKRIVRNMETASLFSTLLECMPFLWLSNLTDLHLPKIYLRTADIHPKPLHFEENERWLFSHEQVMFGGSEAKGLYQSISLIRLALCR